MSLIQLFRALAEQLIHSKYDRMLLRSRKSDSVFEEEEIECGGGIGMHLTPTACKREMHLGI